MEGSAEGTCHMIGPAARTLADGPRLTLTLHKGVLRLTLFLVGCLLISPGDTENQRLGMCPVSRESWGHWVYRVCQP